MIVMTLDDSFLFKEGDTDSIKERAIFAVATANAYKAGLEGTYNPPPPFVAYLYASKSDCQLQTACRFAAEAGSEDRSRAKFGLEPEHRKTYEFSNRLNW